MYKVPWIGEYSPNAWIEPSTHCQLKCPNCYRGTDLEGFRPARRPLREMKSEIDQLLKLRRLQTLTISGGDPLLYPDLDELVGYACQKNLAVMLVTNGILLDGPQIGRLRRIGVSRVLIHVDKYQGREGLSSETDLLKLRLRYCDLFRNITGISMGFIMPLSASDVSDIDVLIPFFIKHSDVIRVVMLTLRQELLLPGGAPSGAVRRADLAGVTERIAAHYGFEYCGYLGKVKSDSVSWLFGMALCSDGEPLGWADAAAFRHMQEEQFGREGRYYMVCNKIRRSPGFILFALLNKSLRKAFLRSVFAGSGKRVHTQAVIVLNTPSKLGDGWDFCAGCPDAMIFNGRLVPSCLLENVKAGEHIGI